MKLQPRLFSQILESSLLQHNTTLNLKIDNINNEIPSGSICTLLAHRPPPATKMKNVRTLGKINKKISVSVIFKFNEICLKECFLSKYTIYMCMCVYVS